MVLKPETIGTWVNTLTPIFESKTFSLMLALGFAFFVYWTSQRNLEDQHAINKELWLYIQASHTRQISMAMSLARCEYKDIGRGE